MGILIDASRLVDDWIRTEYPHQQVIRYGHSMGSFLTLNLEKNHVVSDGLILTGSTIEPNWLLRVQSISLKIMGLLFGEKTPAKLAHAIRIAPLNRPFKWEGNEHAWVSRMSSVLQQYDNDPYCANMVSWGFFNVLNQLLCQMNHLGDIQLPPVLIITGSNDPLSKGGKKLDALINRLAPLSPSVQHVVVPGARHKIECDEEQPMILEKIDSFLEEL